MGKENETIEEMYGELSTKVGGRALHSILLKKFAEVEGEDHSLQRSTFWRLSGGILKTLGGVICEYRTPGGEGKKDIKFLLKYWEPVEGVVSALLRRDSKSMQRELRNYALLTGMDGVPKAYHIEAILREEGYSEENIQGYLRELRIIPRSILLEYIEGDTLAARLGQKKPEDKASRKQIIAEALESIMDFEIEATRKLGSVVVPPNGLGGIFDERTMDGRALDYIRAIMGFASAEELPPDVKEKISKAYAPIKDRYSKPPVIPLVCHGDLTTSNIVCNNGKYYFIDYHLKFRDNMVDLTSLLASPGTRLGAEEWEELAGKFALLLYQKIGAVPKMEAEKTGFLHPTLFSPAIAERIMQMSKVKPTMALNEEVQRGIFNSLYNLVLHHSFRNYAIFKDLERLFPGRYRANPEETREMGANMRTALGRLINEQERLGVSPENATLYKDLEKLLNEIDVLQAETDEEDPAKKKAIAAIQQGRMVKLEAEKFRGAKTPAQ